MGAAALDATRGMVRDARGTIGRVAASVIFMASIFVGAWWLNRKGARKLDQAIGELDNLQGEVV